MVAPAAAPPPEVPTARHGFWALVRDRWGTALVLAAAIGLGWRVAVTLVTRTELEKHASGEGSIRAQVGALAADLAAVKAEIAAARTDIAAGKAAADATRADIRALTVHLLERPAPGPRRTP